MLHDLTPRQYSDLELLATQVYAPLSNFMDKDDYWAVINTMHLTSGELWSIPIVFQLHEDEWRVDTEEIILFGNGIQLATLGITEVFHLDLEVEARKIYGTTSHDHPGAAMLLNSGSVGVAGELIIHEIPKGYAGSEYLLPTETKRLFADKGWKTIAGFQTRNPIHRAHEYLHKLTLELVDGLLISPLVGPTKAGDIPVPIRMDTYRVLLERYYPPKRTLLGVYPGAMRYAGPREAVHHAISRRNYGCTHFIVGRDHAGVGGFYSPYDSHKIFDTLDSAELGIEILRFDDCFYCTRCGQFASKRTCPHRSNLHLALSGSKIRELLAAGSPLPPEWTRPEVAEVLARNSSLRPSESTS